MKARFMLFGGCVLLSAIPLLCQTDTSSLSCWESRRNGTFQTRRAKTPIAKSGAGSAYAEVTAEASTDSGQAQFCKNRVQLFYARDGSNYKVAYEKAGLDDQGVGIHVLGWSHNGMQLLMEITVWGYDRDGDPVKSAWVLDSKSVQVTELPLDDAFQRLFGKDCEFESSVLGWQEDDGVLIRVNKTPPTKRYQQTFCVQKPTVYAFSQATGTVSPGKASSTSAHAPAQ